MRYAVVLVLITMLAIGACKKDKTTPLNTWKLDKDNYTVTMHKWIKNDDSTDIILFSNDTSYYVMISFTFFKRPTTAGTYKIVYDPKAADEVSIVLRQKYNDLYESENDAGAYLSVTNNNGSLHYTATKVHMINPGWLTDGKGDCSFNLVE